MDAGAEPLLDVLLVDADASAVDAIRNHLEAAGLEVRSAASADAALALARAHRPELIVTEMTLPDLSGLGLCRALREEPELSGIPIVMTSATAGEMDRVVAFEMGIDDFVSKPFHVRELGLRVRAILRRTRRGSGREPERGVLQHGIVCLDPAQRVTRVYDQPVALTAKEFDLLATLMQHRGRALSRGQILREVWGLQSTKTARVVDTHVKWVRRKLGSAGRYIETLRGVGYRFTDRQEEGSAAGDSRSSA